MPTFEVQNNGQTYEVDAPDMASASSALTQHFSQQAPSVGADVVKSLGVGAVKGGIEGAGSIGDVRSMLSSGADYLGNKIGLSPDVMGALKTGAAKATQAFPGLGPIATAPTSEQLQRGVEGVTGPLYQPQTLAGQSAERLGKFGVAALAGPGSLGKRALTQTVLPYLASEGAGALTQGTAAEPYARAGAAFAAGAGATALANRAPKEVLPTAEQIRAAASAQYKAPEVESVQFTPQSINGLADNISARLNKLGFRNTSAEAGSPTFGAVNDLRQPIGTGSSLNVGASMGAGQKVVNPGTPGAPATVADLQAVRTNLGVMATELNAQGRPTANAAAAKIANQEIGKFLDNLKQPDLIAGDAQLAAKTLREANQNWASQAKALEIDARLSKAERQAAKSGTGSNLDNAIRQKMAQILDVPSRQVGYTKDEIAQMERIVNGAPLTNAMRWVGKLGPHGALSAMANLGAATASHGLTIPLSIGAVAARKLAERGTRQAAEELQNSILRRSALAQTPQFQTQAPYLPSPSLPGVNVANPYYLPRPSPAGPVIGGLLPALLAGR